MRRMFAHWMMVKDVRRGIKRKGLTAVERERRISKNSLNFLVETINTAKTDIAAQLLTTYIEKFFKYANL